MAALPEYPLLLETLISVVQAEGADPVNWRALLPPLWQLQQLHEGNILLRLCPTQLPVRS